MTAPAGARAGAHAESGVFIDVHHDAPAEEVFERARLAEEKLDVGAVWLPQFPNQRESTTLLAGLATATARVTLGTAIVPIYTRPPVVMAQTAATLDELCGGRLVLGLGLSHPLTSEWMLGATVGPPLASMREYLAVVLSILREGEVGITGRWFSGHATYSAPRRELLPVYVGAFGPRMLRLAGELADGVLLTMCSPRYVREHVVPNVHAGRRRAGLPVDDFPVVASMPAVLSSHPSAREYFRRYVAAYLRMPSYRRLFELSGFGDCLGSGRVSDAMVDALGAVGEAEVLRQQAAAYREAGATSVAVSPMHEDRIQFLDAVAAAVG